MNCDVMMIGQMRVVRGVVVVVVVRMYEKEVPSRDVKHDRMVPMRDNGSDKLLNRIFNITI
jgi:hypothetical protein